MINLTTSVEWVILISSRWKSTEEQSFLLLLLLISQCCRFVFVLSVIRSVSLCMTESTFTTKLLTATWKTLWERYSAVIPSFHSFLSCHSCYFCTKSLSLTPGGALQLHPQHPVHARLQLRGEAAGVGQSSSTRQGESNKASNDLSPRAHSR